MKAIALILAVMFGISDASVCLGQPTQSEAPELGIFAQKGAAYRKCVDQEFDKLTVPNLDDEDVFPLLKIKDEDVFGTVRTSCDDLRHTLMNEAPGSALTKLVEDWEAIVGARLLRIAQNNRATLAPKARAIRTPGPRPAVPLIELVDDYDYPFLNGKREPGRTKATYTVGTDGRASNCKAVGGPDYLNGSTCSVIVRRWRYAPAIDAAGRPVAEIRTKVINLKNG